MRWVTAIAQALGLVLGLTLVSVVARPPGSDVERDYFHQRAEAQTMQGWQEPGLWRPKWIVDREFTSPNGTVLSSDKIFLRLRNDRSIQLVDPKKRPVLIWRRPPSINQKRNVPQGQDENADQSTETRVRRARRAIEELAGTMGSWWWTDEAPLPTSRVVMETSEGPNEDKYHYEIRCTWGKMDGYAAQFKTGQMFRYQGISKSAVGKSVPINAAHCGFFTMRTNPHRPMVAKDFQAFQ